MMQAKVGDRIIIRAHKVGASIVRDCEVLEVLGPDGRPPYRVRWGEDGHESLFFPGTDAAVAPYEHRGVSPRSRGADRRRNMQVIEATRRSAVGVGPQQTVQQVAELMEQANVGCVAVIDDARLVGIVTDRDLVRRAMACGLSSEARVDSVMTSPVVTIDAHADLHTAFAILGEHAVRRLAIVDDGRFVGTVTVDDLVIDMAADLSSLARPLTAEVIFGHHDSPLPAVP